jgi:hypothetical protein
MKAGVVLCPLREHASPSTNNDCDYDERCVKAMKANGLKMSGPQDELLVAVTEFHVNNTILVSKVL